LRWKKEVQEQIEEQRKEIDKEEERLKKILSEKVIQRAKKLNYEEKQKVRFLRSQQLYTDVIETRKQQIREKAQTDARIMKEDKRWHDQAMKIVCEVSKKEKMDLFMQKQKARKIGVMLLQQKAEKEAAMERKGKQQKKDEERVIKRVVLDDMAEEQRHFHEKLTAKKNAKQEMDKLSKDMKNAREKRIGKEEEETMKRENQIKHMTLLTNARAELEVKHFEQRQAAQTILSDKVAEEFSVRAANERELFVKQQKKQESIVRARQDQEARERKEMETKIHRSRKVQIKFKYQKKAEEAEEDVLLCNLYYKMSLQEQEKEKKEQQDRRHENMKFRRYQEKQINERHEQNKMEREAELQREKDINEGFKIEDNLFQEFALREMEQFRQYGKMTGLLDKCIKKETRHYLKF